MIMSGWLSAISALDRRLNATKLSFSQFVMLSYLHEAKGIDAGALIKLASHDDETQTQQSQEDLSYLTEIGLIEHPEDTVVMCLTDLGKVIIREAYQVVQGRIVAPVFAKPTE